MRRFRTLGLGLGFALSGSSLLAQTPGATLGPVRVIDPQQPTITAVRAQAPEIRPAPVMDASRLQPMRMVPVVQDTTGGLGQPKPVPTPMVTELRDINGQPLPQSYVVPNGQPVPQPYAVPYGSPAPTVIGAPPQVIGDCGTPGCGGAGMPLRMDDPYFGGPILGRRLGLLGGAPAGRFSLTGEYLMMWVRDQEFPPLLTTSSPQFNGIIGQGNTQVILGGDAPTRTLQSGAKFWANYWFPSMRYGIDGGVFWLGRSGTTFSADSGTYTVLARPFISANTGQNSSELIAFPGLSVGSGVVVSNSYVFGAEANVRRAMIGTQCSRLDALVGFKYLHLNEDTTITETFTRIPGAAGNNPNVLGGRVIDQFQTENNFYGVNVGLMGERRMGRWYMNGRATVGIGSVNQKADIYGTQQLNTPNGQQNFAGGLLALPNANMGVYSQTKFAVAPEAGLNFGYYLTPHMRIGVGYNFLYLSSAVRPSGVIDQTIDVNRVPNFTAGPAVIGTVRPAPVLNTGDFFAQGVSFQLQWTW